MPEIEAPFPAKLSFLFEPYRYKVLWGGRGSGKSWGIARALLLIGVQRPLRVLCAREYQNSIADSVHKLLSDQIAELKLDGLYEIQQKNIFGPNGTSFGFEGVKNNPKRIKSYEGVDVCWVEEADTVSEESWDILIPTIRKSGSEIWVSFNPNVKTDYTFRFFIQAPPKDAKVVELNWRDNEWFPEELRLDMERLRDTDYDKYLHVYEGHCKRVLAGAVYADEIRAALAERRITKVPYQPEGGAVDVFFDLGWSDATALWFRQRVGFEWHYIRYYSNRLKKFEHYLDFIDSTRYRIGTLWLPHDAKAKEKGTGLSIEELARKSGRQVRIVKGLSVEDGINAARTIFSSCWFDETECEDGVQALTEYRYNVLNDATGHLSKVPVHDHTSHGADAFRYSAVATKQPRSERLEAQEVRLQRSLGLKPPPLFVAPQADGWLGR